LTFFVEAKPCLVITPKNQGIKVFNLSDKPDYRSRLRIDTQIQRPVCQFFNYFFATVPKDLQQRGNYTNSRPVRTVSAQAQRSTIG